MHITTALCENEIASNPETTNTLIKQTIIIKHGEQHGTYTVIRDLDDGGNISYVDKHFENLPFLKDGKLCYDKDLAVLDKLFSSYNEDAADIDQLLWEMDIVIPEKVEITLNDFNEDGSELKTNVVIEIITNEIRRKQ